MADYPGHAAYYWRHKARYVAWFCNAADVEPFLENGEEAEVLSAIGTEPEPGVTYRDEGHFHCMADDCPEG